MVLFFGPSNYYTCTVCTCVYMNVVYLFPKNNIKCPFKTTIYVYIVVLKGHYILKGTFGKMYASCDREETA